MCDQRFLFLTKRKKICGRALMIFYGIKNNFVKKGYVTKSVKVIGESNSEKLQKSQKSGTLQSGKSVLRIPTIFNYVKRV
jgi:hypothetical protein